MMFDARAIARGWLAVALAASGDRDRPQLYRTVHLEEHLGGLRIVATDGYVLLHVFVPARGHDETDYPALDEAPISTATAMDPHGRGKGFLAHVLKLATTLVDGVLPEPIDVRVSLNKAASVRDDPQGTLTGLEARAVVLEHAGVERIELDVYDGAYPNVRAVLAQLGEGVPTPRLLLNPELVGRLAKVGKIHPRARIGWSFTGEDRPARVEFIDSDPYVDGLVMPVVWDFDRNAPATAGADDEGQADDELDGQGQLDDDAPDTDPAAHPRAMGENWTESRRRALDVARAAFPDPARIGVGMWNDDGPPIVSPAPARWLLDRGLVTNADEHHVELTPAGSSTWDALHGQADDEGPVDDLGDDDHLPCPMGCGRTTDDVAGGPCSVCWATAPRSDAEAVQIDLERAESALDEVGDPFAGFPS